MTNLNSSLVSRRSILGVGAASAASVLLETARLPRRPHPSLQPIVTPAAAAAKNGQG